MISKLIVLCFVALAAAKPQHLPAHQFPAGVNPALCPGYPNCDNALLHNPQPHHGGHWNAPAPAAHWGAPAAHWGAPAGHWGAPAHHAYNPVTSNHLPAAAKYPAGVSPHTCPNYPYCDNAHTHGVPHVAPLPGWSERQYPAGVSPHECPNFPYCH